MNKLLIFIVQMNIFQKMAYNLNLKHTLFNMDQLAVNSNLIDRYQLYETDHSIYLINYYHENRSFNHCIHLKSTIFELAKVLFRSGYKADSFYRMKMQSKMG